MIFLRNLRFHAATTLTATMLAGATLPASATVSNTNSQHLTSGKQSTLLLAEKGNIVAKPSNNKNNKWHLDKKDAKLNQLTPVEQHNLEKFQKGLAQGLSPNQAAHKIPNAKYAGVKGAKDEYLLYLSKETCVQLLVDQKGHVVRLVPTSGYFTTPPMKTIAPPINNRG